MSEQPTTALFPLGQMVGTPGALKALSEAGENAGTYFLRHQVGDDGDLSENDKQLNKDAIASGERVMSVYHLSTGQKIYCITEWARDVSTILLPEEY